MIDFTNCQEIPNFYSGSEKKKTLIYNNERYLVKFPDPIREKNKKISYVNNALSEYIGSHIFELCGFDVQETILGKYLYHDKEKIVCACKNFNTPNQMLLEFENLVLSTELDKKIDTELKDIINVLKTYKDFLDINANDFINRFYDMFIIDFLIGNTDRHNGNWGLIIDDKNKYSFSTIYDCGSSLNPLLDDEDIKKMDEVEIKNLALNIFSVLKENGKKIHYASYIKEFKNKDVTEALKRVFPKINIDVISKFIDNIECISDIRKAFYKKIIQTRYDVLKKCFINQV